MTDPLPLAQALLRCRSITPADDGAQDCLAAWLTARGFTVHRLTFGTTPNLFARRGTDSPHLAYAGHTDVVPALGDWTHDPFAATVAGGRLYGRGAIDMKGSVAAFAAAAASPRPGSVSLIITGDEEGPATDGTVRVLPWMAEHGHIPDACLVGEPVARARPGDTIRIGRRGSLNAIITMPGEAGHTAWPERARNPIHPLLAALHALATTPLDSGSDAFPPSILQITSVDVGNEAHNVIPAEATARFNIRFNDHHTPETLAARLREVLAAHAPGARLAVECNAEPFRTQPGPFVRILTEAAAEALGEPPLLDTAGGTSDARFIARYCPVAEMGPVGLTMHQADENIEIAHLNATASLYAAVLDRFLGPAA